MSTLKARFDEDEAMRLLTGLFPDVRDLHPLTGGEVSRAYAFASGGRQLVLRVNHHLSYRRDAWASARFRHTAVPAPQVIRTGQHESHHWAISERAAGSSLDGQSLAQLAPLLDQIVGTLVAIHEAPVTDTTGYGWVDDVGNGAHPSWKAFMLGEGTYGGLVDWDTVRAQADDGDRKLIEEPWSIAHTLLDHCPEERVLNHGDYSLDNIIADGHRITGVVDWSGCIYGDPVMDVAWADFWRPDLGFAAAWFRATPTENSGQRLTCYKLLIAAQSLGFYIHTGQPDKGRWLAVQAEALLQTARPLAIP